MSRSFNSLSMTGKVASDIEYKEFNDGATKMVKFFLEESRPTSGDNFVIERYPIICWGKTAESAKEELQEGDRIVGVGKLSSSSWTNEEGEKRYKTEVLFNTIIKIG